MSTPMADPNRHQRDKELVESLRKVASKCDAIGRILAHHKAAQAKLQKRAKIANYLVAGGVMIFGFVSSIESVKAYVGNLLPLTLAVLGAAFLLLEAYTPSILDDPNPDRFGDYSRYIFKYTRGIEQLLQDTMIPEADWNARAWLLYEWARVNIDDVAEKWPWVETKYVESQKADASPK